MINLYKIILLSVILVQIGSSRIEAQLIRQDDFQYKNNYWYWRSDGNQSQPVVAKGLLHLKLQNAISTEYCNNEIYDPTEPYQPGTQIRVRLKNSNIHNGSRGWGFWDGDLDTISIVFDFDVAWVMQQGSSIENPVYNWFLFGTDGDYLTNRQTFDLQKVVDETQWHTYKIIWGLNSVSIYIDDKFIYETFAHLPDEAMRMDIWIDNRVINLSSPLELWNNNVENSEMLVDFIEISGINGPNVKREKKSNVALWQTPNTFPDGDKESLWKSYNFQTSSDGEALIFLTGSAESYGHFMDDDDLRIVIDNQDFGWDTNNSFDGNSLNGKGKSVVFPIELSKGEHNIDIYSDITPFLRDVIVIFSENGKMLYTRNYNETANGNDGLWKTIEFITDISSEVTIVISGVANEKNAIRFALDNINFGWKGEDAIDGDDLRGLPNTVVINEMLDPGSHTLKIYNKGNPQLYSVAVYGNSSITDVIEETIPSESIYLGANPNPFNISTSIYYKTQTSSHNNISIVNVLGQKVETLVDDYQQKGEYNLVWNATNETSGIYFCILESDNYFRVEKLLLLK
jgi:Secretion system C-terminal sorting domain